MNDMLKTDCVALRQASVRFFCITTYSTLRLTRR